MAKNTPIDIIKGVSDKLVAESRKNTSPRTSVHLNLTPLSKHPQSTQNFFFAFIPHPILHHISSKLPINYPKIPLF